MKAIWMAGAMATALLAGPVFADDYNYPPAAQSQTTTTTTEKSSDVSIPATTTATPNDQSNKSTIVEEHTYTSTVPAAQPVKKEASWMKGGEFLLSGGVEGYGGSIAPEVRAGPSWGVRLGVKPTRVLGVELGYSGATNEINSNNNLFMGPGMGSGADIVRNGGDAVATVALLPTPVQPYVLGGIDYSFYDVRHSDGFLRSGASAGIPVGLGLRAHAKSHFTADARFGYDFLFMDQFAHADSRLFNNGSIANGGRYNLSLNLGSTF